MLHELKEIFTAAKLAHQQNIKTVLATVVSLNGSSYRKPGVRMLIQENDSMIGAVSGGCVEKEILHQAQSVFKNNTPKLITYDGRYRLGCEGILYILIEPFVYTEKLYNAFILQCKNRIPFTTTTYFSKNETNTGGSIFKFKNENIPLSPQINTTIDSLTENVKTAFQLYIVGTEHDAVTLTKYAKLTGWDVHIVSTGNNGKSIADFNGADSFFNYTENEFQNIAFDSQTAIVFMTHSYVKDLQYLHAISNKKLNYIGLLGPSKRREKLLNELVELNPEIEDFFFDTIYGPAGINIGAETPQEIAISIIAEILAVFRQQEPILLRDKTSGIHQ